MIKEFKPGLKVEQIVIVRVQKVGNTSKGGIFARGLLEDNSGMIPFICFEAGIVERLRQLEAPKAMLVGGNVDINKLATDMSLQFFVQKLEAVQPKDDISGLLPAGNVDLKAYEKKLQFLMVSIKEDDIRNILQDILSGELYEQFIINPAGMRLHHAYIGGLLHHSVCVAELALAMADKIGEVNKDLILAGALLHDVGKLLEISSEIGFPYTTEGRLLGHISISAMLVQKTADKLGLANSEKVQLLLHIILSHHGEQEKGSPVACATKESFIVHYADEIDAIMNQFATKEDRENWEYNKMLQRFLLHQA